MKCRDDFSKLRRTVLRRMQSFPDANPPILVPQHIFFDAAAALQKRHQNSSLPALKTAESGIFKKADISVRHRGNESQHIGRRPKVPPQTVSHDQWRMFQIQLSYKRRVFPKRNLLRKHRVLMLKNPDQIFFVRLGKRRLWLTKMCKYILQFLLCSQIKHPDFRYIKQRQPLIFFLIRVQQTSRPVMNDRI